MQLQEANWVYQRLC